MSSKSLPAYLQQVLQQHVEKSELTHDKELEGIYDRLSSLNERVENIKAEIKRKRMERQ
ncbi:hypothetical protein [Aliiglaciecola sp. LCG003]|uniref:hypothetical protein n=1 Tax=Aliiglaciecola sp. LCG003 TaxID=3053655 RepID=UPI0025727422|nr:hypothetical protein [Aliiglaciecola sp. LCG003]WJG10637.1 hypothetical protein QR722_06235 [Aliiglaciecola sp. LCG003]